MKEHSLKYFILLAGVLILGACSNGSGDKAAPGPIDLKALSASNYRKDSDLSLEEYTAQAQGLQRDCTVSDKAIRVGSSFHYVEDGTNIFGTMHFDRTETVFASSRSEVKLGETYNSLILSYFQGDILTSNHLEKTCSINTKNNVATVKCSDNAETHLTEAFKSYSQAHPQSDLACHSESQGSNDSTSDVKKTYEKGTYTFNDGRSVPVFLVKLQWQVKQKCGTQAAQNYTISVVEGMSANVMSHPDESKCGSAQIFTRYIQQDAANQVQSDYTRQMVQGPVK